MSSTLSLLALGNVWLVMFSLGLGAPGIVLRPNGWLAALLLGYLRPGRGLLALTGLGLEPPHLQGLALCIAAGFGTSGAALHRLAGGDAEQAAHLVIGSSLLALPLIPLLLAYWLEAALAPALLGQLLLLCLLGQTLPYALGRSMQRWQPGLSRKLAMPVEKVAGLMVIGLIILIAQQTLPLLREQHRLLLAASLIVSLLLLANLSRRPIAEGNPQMLLLVRNLGGAVLLARLLPDPREALLAISAFGVPMYAVALLSLLRHRRNPSHSPG